MGVGISVGLLVAMAGLFATISSIVQRGISVERFNQELRREVEDRKKAQALAERLRNRTQSILNTAGDGIFGLDPEGAMTFANRAAGRILGHDPETLIGHLAHDTFHHTRHDGTRFDWDECPIHKALSTGTEQRATDEFFYTAEGHGFPVEYIAAPVLDTDQTVGVVVTFGDVSEARELEAQLRRSVQSKSELIASVSHEIRTPLTGILGFIDLLRHQSHEFTPAEQRAMIASAADEAADLSNIVDDLLAAARSEMGTLKVTSVPVDLAAQTAQVLESRDDHDRVMMEPGPARAIGDPARVRQILRNLTTNALRYGGPNIQVRFEHRASTIALLVTDDGPGIPADDQETIFESYVRSKSAPGVPGSLGLGLTVSRNLARLMSGTLTYRREGNESIFELELPALPV